MEQLSKRQTNRIKRKEAKAKSILLKHEVVKLAESATKMLYISNAGLGNGLSRENVYSWLSVYGQLQDIIMLERKPYCFVVTCEVEVSERIAAESGCIVQHEGLEQGVEHFIFYVEDVPTVCLPNPQLPEGLLLLPDYISEECEHDLLNLVEWTNQNDSAASHGEMKNRQVKHYGYEFKYTTNNVDPDEPLDDCIPELCKKLCDRLIADGHMTERPDQLTVNKYDPGQGIPPHVDTHSAFTDLIVSVSLGSQVVMTFSYVDDTRQVLLPRRSVLIMSGASRYSWTHGIVPRKTDVITNSDRGSLTLGHRETRVSFTFRRLRRAACQCAYPEQCDSQEYGRQQKQVDSTLQDLTDESAKRLEAMHVHQVYDNIAPHFSGTRHKQWPKVVEFLHSVPAGSLIADIGCGNGKYLPMDPNHLLYKIGFERSSELAGICHSRNYPIIQADCLATPLRDEAVDACICIAVIHHLATESRRRTAIEELLRIVCVGGKCLVYVWAMEQSRPHTQSQAPAPSVNSTYLKSGSSASSTLDVNYLSTLEGECQLPVHRNRTQFASTDMLVPWNLKTPSHSKPSDGDRSTDTIASHMDTSTNSTPGSTCTIPSDTSEKSKSLFHRYYHIFKEGELERMCSTIPNCEITNSYYDEGNWCVVLTKTA